MRAILTGGMSKSVVALFQADHDAAQPGLLTVVKVGSRADAAEELRRYQEHVRFRVSLHRRVELLAACLGDTLAALCYSFAGHAPDQIQDLQGLLDSGDPAAIGHIGHLFGPGAEEWLAVRGEHEDEALFFGAAYSLDMADVEVEIERFAKAHAADFGATCDGAKLDLGKYGAIALPVGFEKDRLHGEYASCVVHGDLNAGNVLVDRAGRELLIDFRRTGDGPRALDFSALQASARLALHSLDEVTRVMEVHKTERRLWSRAWTDEQPSLRHPDPLPYWAQVSEHLLRHAYRSLPGLDPQEHAVTSLLYAMRLFRIHQLEPRARFRLIVWMSALVEVVRDRRVVS